MLRSFTIKAPATSCSDDPSSIGVLPGHLGLQWLNPGSEGFFLRLIDPNPEIYCVYLFGLEYECAGDNVIRINDFKKEIQTDVFFSSPLPRLTTAGFYVYTASKVTVDKLNQFQGTEAHRI